MKVFIYIFKLFNNIIRWRPWSFGLIYIGNIILFSILYWLCFDTDFKGIDSLQYIQSLYFSIVTVTTLGYGDITPNINTHYLLSTIIVQVFTGIFLIGLFLNAISHKLSDLKDKALNDKVTEDAEIMLTKYLALLKPIIEKHLKTLSEIYTVTSTTKMKNFHTAPEDLFNEHYYDCICSFNYYAYTYSFEKDFNKDILWCEYLIGEYEIYTQEIESFLIKFSTNLPIEVITYLTTIQNSLFLSLPKSELEYFHLPRPQKVTPCSVGGTLEHSTSSFNLPKEEQTIRNYHQTLLALVNIIDKYLPTDKCKLFVRLDSKHINIGSAIIKDIP